MYGDHLGHHGHSSVTRLTAQRNQQESAKVFVVIKFPMKGSQPAGSTCQVSIAMDIVSSEKTTFKGLSPCLVPIASLISSMRSFKSEQEICML